MDYSFENKRNEQNDRRKSAIITIAIATLVLLFIYFYQFTRLIPKTDEVVTTMLINFGDNNNGNGFEEPANQEGSVAANTNVAIPQPQPPAASEAKQKVITGNSTVVSAPKVEKKSTSKSSTKSVSTTQKTSTANTKSSSKSTQGDGKGTAAVGNLIRGRGTSSGTQGTNGTTGNAGDPLGGDGNGDSKIGIDRKLVSFIPGTMGRGGSQPSQNCSVSGTITIAYTVDKAGNVVSARRSGGVSDACVVSTSIAWVKQYVKAERANTTSSGTYKITF